MDSVRLTVRDTGVGLDRENTDRLFDTFYTTKNDGMGIGLSISRSSIERHRGRLWAESNDGPGATFTLWLPRTEDTLEVSSATTTAWVGEISDEAGRRQHRSLHDRRGRRCDASDSDAGRPI